MLSNEARRLIHGLSRLRRYVEDERTDAIERIEVRGNTSAFRAAYVGYEEIEDAIRKTIGNVARASNQEP